MNLLQYNAIKIEISNVEDNLNRYKLQRNAMPDWKSGNGEPIDSIISDLEDKLKLLKEGINE